MKLSLATLILCSGLALSTAQAFSLYDTAPAIGLAQNAGLKYNASFTLGYDDNINGSAKNEDGSMFVRFGLGASQSKNDAMTRITWSARVGGTIYTEDADGTSDKTFADINVALAVVHTIDERSQNKFNLRASITPDLDYSNGISGANREGDSLNWSVNDTYTRKLDERKSLSFTAGYSGNIYLSNYYDIDDREYLSLRSTLSHKADSLTTYSLALKGQLDFRRYGNDSQNAFVIGGVQRVLNEVSSIGLNVGAQAKFIEGGCDLYPNVRFSYRRTVAEGLSLSTYACLENENVDTYSYSYGNYDSDMAWRFGGNLTQMVNSRLSAVAGYSIIISQYSANDSGYSDRDEVTYNGYAGLNYLINSRLTASARYSYTIANKSAGDYDRNMISASLKYSF